MYRYVILAVALLALGEAAKDFKCPSVVGKYPFDEAKFAGEWFVVAGVPPKGGDEKKCAKFNMNSLRTGSESTMTIQMSAIINGKPKNAEIFSQAFKSGDKSSMSYAVYKKAEETKWSDIYKQTVIATDYDNYAIMLACQTKFDETTKTFSRDMHAGIYGRKTTLPEETLKTLKNILTGYDINYADIKTMDHTNCDAKLKI